MSVLSPSAWEGVSTVSVLIVLALFHGVALVKGWIIYGPAHREIVKAKDDALEDLRGGRAEDKSVMATLAATNAELAVTGELSAHVVQAIREATGQRSEAAGNAGPI
ncbi:hypothetical protein L1080_003370 [Rhodococcus sp. MSC1_016]|jgi:hypothetical protein|uniref:hypothetical protein n=1 Tax=Rhodococcus sp. MSC1_016 TaxID=2909266 RepID=UPI00202F9F2E|nr:hypothetical protein [Rhodococcus sp. MSC1_016]